MEMIKKKVPHRSYSGEMWKTNEANKKRLKIDFHNRCAYCDDHDIYSGGYNNYHVEHFAPKIKFPLLVHNYDNLLYACPYCNISKSNKWPSDNSIVNVIGDEGFIDPCCSDYYLHLSRDKNGEIIYLTRLGQYMYFELKLYLKRHEIIYNLDQIRDKQQFLKNEIIKRNENGKDVSKLKEVYKDLCVVFCEYFDFFDSIS